MIEQYSASQRKYLKPGQLAHRNPARTDGVAIGFIAQLAADHGDRVNRIHEMQVMVADQPTIGHDGDETIDRGSQSGFLVDLAYRGGLGMFTVIDSAAGQDPPADLLRQAGSDPSQQDTAIANRDSGGAQSLSGNNLGHAYNVLSLPANESGR